MARLVQPPSQAYAGRRRPAPEPVGGEAAGQAAERKLRLRAVPARGQADAAHSAGERLLAKARRLLAVNDEIWATLARSAFAGEVRLAVPNDMAGPFLSLALRDFGQDRPGVRITLKNLNSSLIREASARDDMDVGLTTEQGCGAGGEILFANPLVWVGAAVGTAWKPQPLPVLLGGPTCTFRGPALQALAARGRDWHHPCECSDVLREIAAIQADLAVGAFLRSGVPAGLAPVPPEAALPVFNVNLYVRREHPGGADLAWHLRRGLSLLAPAA